MDILVKTYRGPLEDLFHTGHIAVVNSAGKLLFCCGDPDRVCYARSSAKPIQALCVLEFFPVMEDMTAAQRKNSAWTTKISPYSAPLTMGSLCTFRPCARLWPRPG
jgi:hypothetical protein